MIVADNIHNHNKQLLEPLRHSLYDIEVSKLERQLNESFAPNCVIHLAHPLGSLTGPENLFADIYRPLLQAIPDLERRDFIVMAGVAREQNWVGCAGHYMGVFAEPWLDIPATRHAVYMRYAEFFRFEDERIVEMQSLWDLPQLMMQSDAWPMAPSLGVEWLVPGPATQDGIVTAARDAQQSDDSRQLVLDMLMALKESPKGVAAMQLDRYWHPKMNWYGPAGIGTGRQISGFRHWHQIPFLNGMPDRGSIEENSILFGDNDYVGFTAWPGMRMTLTGDGWMGIVPCDKKLTMRSLDFWHCVDGMIRENWVLVDLLDAYHQLGVDVFARMRQCTAARQVNKPELSFKP